MLVKLDSPKILSDVIGIISELVTEVKIKVDRDGLRIVAIDPANVALVSFILPNHAFSSFEVTDETLGVGLDSLKSILRRAGAGSSLIMQTEDNTLKIEIQDKIKRVFTLALIDIEAEDKQVPNLDFSSKIEMSSQDFSDSIEDCSIVADSCSFAVKDSKFIIEAKGLNSARNEFSGDEVKIDGINAKSKYSLEYLQKFSKAGKLTDKIKINFSDDYPLKIEFKAEKAELVFVLAPRVENED
ncbi:proliferating cell nuclear antigen (pcna) [Candidatus Pacearchaeota archaeon]|nr:proliferating cell nuclear antigen (pcna) [Candidatus Pacearchaeota archaeon]